MIELYLVIEQYNEDMWPTFTKFETEKEAIEYLNSVGYIEFDEGFEQNDGIRFKRSEIDYNTAFIVYIEQ